MIINNKTKNVKLLSQDDLRKIIREELDKKDVDAQQGIDSVDAQIDRFFVKHEKNAKVNESSQKLSFLRKSRYNIAKLNEDTTDDDKDANQSLDDINVETFASDIARLVDNFDSLIETRQVIVRRAVKYLEKSYDKSVISTFKEVLARDYDLEINETQSDSKLNFQRYKFML